jgi:two-component system, OmpR family, sensor histidine kinase SenX3
VNTSAELWAAAILAFVTGAVSTGLVLWTTLKTREAQKKAQIIPDGISGALHTLATAGLVLDLENKIVRATRSAFSLGLVKDQTLVHPKLLALVDKARKTKKASKARAKDFALASAIGGNTIWVNSRAVHLGDGFVLLLVEDRTESHNLEETRRDFVANISHELKTPIGAISLLAEAIQSAADDPDQVSKFARNLETESTRLTQLVQDIIQLSRVQSAEVAGSTQEVDLGLVVAEAVDRNRVQANKKKINVKVDAKEGIRVFGDLEMLTTAVKNLIENAISYSEPDTTVNVVLRKKSGVAEISVRDRGAGISPEDLERIFERFYRIDPSRSRATGGTGLGLSLVKNITQKHLGEVQVKSKVSSGSTFTIRLPLAPVSIDASGSKKQ